MSRLVKGLFSWNGGFHSCAIRAINQHGLAFKIAWFQKHVWGLMESEQNNMKPFCKSVYFCFGYFEIMVTVFVELFPVTANETCG